MCEIVYCLGDEILSEISSTSETVFAPEITEKEKEIRATLDLVVDSPSRDEMRTTELENVPTCQAPSFMLRDCVVLLERLPNSLFSCKKTVSLPRTSLPLEDVFPTSDVMETYLSLSLDNSSWFDNFSMFDVNGNLFSWNSSSENANSSSSNDDIVDVTPEEVRNSNARLRSTRRKRNEKQRLRRRITSSSDDDDIVDVTSEEQVNSSRARLPSNGSKRIGNLNQRPRRRCEKRIHLLGFPY